MKDIRGNEIEVGAVVAYNLSGTIAIGRITKIVPRQPYHGEDAWHAVNIHVDPLKTFFSKRTPSKIARPENLLVLP